MFNINLEEDQQDTAPVRASKQRVQPCSSCPMLPKSAVYFSQLSLETSVVKNIEQGYVHPCHSDESYACAGCLSFIKQHEPGGLAAKHVVSFAIGTGLFDAALIKNLPVYNSIDEMLAGHAQKSKLATEFSDDIF